MRILFTSFPALGHLHPIVPLALAARDAGHDVRVATGPDLVPWVQRCGLPAVPVGISQDAATAEATRRRGPQHTEDIFTEIWMPAALGGLLALTSAWRVDLIVHEEQEYAAVLLAAILEVRCVTHSWSAPARPGYAREDEQRRLQRYWDHYLPGRSARRVGDLYLDACPPPFQTPDIGDIARETPVRSVAPSTFDGPDGAVVPAEPARPAAYLTFGTVPVFSTADALSHVARMLANTCASVVVATGPNTVESLGELPGNVTPTPYLPQSRILPGVDLVVSHGGAGSTLGAIMHGLPHLVLPGHGLSQMSNADAVQRLGAGVQLAPSERDGAHLAASVHLLLGEPAYARAARTIRDQLRRLASPGEVIAYLTGDPAQT
jgi:UDP:flavonoid glycosyltransferase YjiC (YdhE family)